MRPDWAKKVLATEIGEMPAIRGNFTIAVTLEFTQGLSPDKFSKPSDGASQELLVSGKRSSH